MLTVLWDCAPNCPAQEVLLVHVFAAACDATSTDESAEVTVMLTGDARLQEFNRTHRGVDAPTDVLSFAQRDALPVDAGCKPALPPEGSTYLGDIAISLERVHAQATAYGHSEERELAYLFVHGFLHLLGHTHAEEAAYKKMRKQEESILSAACLPHQDCETAGD